ncbi:MAG: LytTR family transcriptional regulator DNA-binding domain-containing protein, partial [Lachnospiraceae bacterium]|nr:LytTR family transcriptional regulator DNA-binding domain-containing protein [Lachnospiraceae bacterium]
MRIAICEDEVFDRELVDHYVRSMDGAKETEVFGYFVKPLKREEFEQLYREAEKPLPLSAIGEKGRVAENVLIVKQRDRLRQIALNRIIYIESDKRRNIIHSQGEEIAYYGSISALEKELPDSFFRIHKGYIIHMRYVERYDRTQVFLKNKEDNVFDTARETGSSDELLRQAKAMVNGYN